MGVARKSGLAVLMIIICASVAASLDDQEAEEVFLSHLADSITGDVNTEMAELLYIKCNLDLIQLKEVIDGLDLCSKDRHRSTDEINLECHMLTMEKMHKMLNVLHPNVRQTLLDCLRKNFHISGDDYGSQVWYARYLELFSFMPTNLRRNLGSRWLQSTEALSPVIAAPPLFSGPAISPAPASSSSQHPKAPNPAVSSGTPFFPPKSSFQPPADKSTSSHMASSPNGQTGNKNNNHKTVIIAVTVTALVTFLVVAGIFFCYYKTSCKVKRPDDNHDRPLLSLSLSEYSVGSSTKFSVFGGSIKEGKPVNQPINLGHYLSSDDNFHAALGGTHTSLQGFQSFGAAGIANKTSTGSSYVPGTTDGLVPPPPGAVKVTSNVMPPLKPPPGRADPLPPEPPSSFKAPSTKASPPPPPPPPAPVPSSRPPGPPPPPVRNVNKAGPTPPPPPKGGIPPPRPPSLAPKGANPPRPPKNLPMEDSEDAPRTKLKPFFWDKVLANPDNSMVWHQIKSGSFQFNEEMIETLFGYTSVDKNKNEGKKGSSSQDSSNQYIQIIDSKKSQNLSILLRALNVTKEEVSDALQEGNELPPELLENLLKMAPTAEEELKLRLFNGDLSQLGPADRFLKLLVDIPFAFKRLESLLFMCTLQEDITSTRESFANLEVACKELRSSRLFLKLLEAVLKTGNRMNDGTFRGGAQAFKLDTLLKLSDVKGKDGKATLLHFVVQEVIRTEGIRAARAAKGSQSLSSIQSKDLLEETSSDSEEDHYSLGLQVVSGLSSELQNVKKSAAIDADGLTGTVARLGHALLKARDFLNKDMAGLGEESSFHKILKSFVQNAEVDIMSLLEEEKRIMSLVKSTGDYFHGNAGKDEGLRLFIIVRDFLVMLDKTCREIREKQKKQMKAHRKGESSADIKHPSSAPNSLNHRRQPSPDLNQLIFPAITDRRIDEFSSDDEGP